MKVNIMVDIAESGNPRKGYHNYDTTVQFQYEEDGTYTLEKEKSIVTAITGTSWMWHSVKSTSEHTWKANYGYDSGD